MCKAPEFLCLKGEVRVMKGIFTLTAKSKRLILIMFGISVIIVISAFFYYSGINQLKDPRVLPVIEMYKQYNNYVNENDFDNVLSVLESMEYAYKQIAHYKDSFELGVIYTDRAAAYLTMALYNSDDDTEKELFLNTAYENLGISLEYYDKWESHYKDMDRAALTFAISNDFTNITEKREQIINNRVKEIEKALLELDRRRSVTYTNLGIVKRHQVDLEGAIVYYNKAIELWENNNSAKSNLNVLLGGEPIKQNFIQKIFPPKKE